MVRVRSSQMRSKTFFFSCDAQTGSRRRGGRKDAQQVEKDEGFRTSMEGDASPARLHLLCPIRFIPRH